MHSLLAILCLAIDNCNSIAASLHVFILFYPVHLRAGITWISRVSPALSSLLASCCDPDPASRVTSARLVDSLLELYPDLLAPLLPPPDDITVAVREMECNCATFVLNIMRMRDCSRSSKAWRSDWCVCPHVSRLDAHVVLLYIVLYTQAVAEAKAEAEATANVSMCVFTSAC